MIVVTVFEADAATRISEVGQWSAVSWLDELDAAGSGSLTLPVDAPELADHPGLLDYRNVVKIAIDGRTVGAWLITKHEWKTAVIPATVTVSGPGLLAWLDDAVIHPEFPDPQAAAVRWFNWGALMEPEWFQHSEWHRPVDMLDVNETTGTRLEGLPANWPDTGTDHDVYWVWDDAEAYESAEPGVMYFRHRIELEDDAHVTVFCTAKSRFEVILDGTPLMNIRERKAWKRTYEVDVDLAAGIHMLGIKVRNTGSWAGMICAVMAYDDPDDDTDDGTLLVWSGSDGWAAQAYPDHEPGWGAGEVLIDLLEDAVARGVTSLGNLAVGFTRAEDTDAQEWAEYAWQFPVGDTYTAAAEAMRDFDCHVAVDPVTVELQAWITRGQVRGDVVVDKVAHANDISDAVEVVLRNALLLSGPDQWDALTDEDSIAAYGRLEAYLDVSALTSRSADKVAAAVLAKAAIPVTGVGVDYTPGTNNIPWAHFGPGDTIWVADRTGGYSQRKVVSIAVTATNTGAAKYALELDAVTRDQLDRLQRIIDGGDSPLGTLGGRSPKRGRGTGTGNARGGGASGLQTQQGVTGYRQPRAAVATLPAPVPPDDLGAGILNAAHATASGSATALGFAVSTAGSTSSVDNDITVDGTPVQRHARVVRKVSGNYGGVYASGSYRYLHTARGFACRFMFGTVAYNAGTALFAGLAHTMPAAAFTSFTGWAAAYALGVAKDSGSEDLLWAWRSGADTAGTDSTGLSWRNGEVYTLDLEADPAATEVLATLSNTFGEKVEHTFTQFPDSSADTAAILSPAVLLGTGNTTTQLAFHSFDSLEPW